VQALSSALSRLLAAVSLVGRDWHFARRSNVSLVVLVVEGTRGIEFMFGIILSVVIANWVAHHIHHDGVYESELERIGNLYFLRDEPPHR
jgi:chloride channel 7